MSKRRCSKGGTFSLVTQRWEGWRKRGNQTREGSASPWWAAQPDVLNRQSSHHPSASIITSLSCAPKMPVNQAPFSPFPPPPLQPHRGQSRADRVGSFSLPTLVLACFGLLCCLLTEHPTQSTYSRSGCSSAPVSSRLMGGARLQLPERAANS